MLARHLDVSSTELDNDTAFSSFDGELLDSNENIPLVIESSSFEEYESDIQLSGSSNVLLNHLFDELGPLEKLPHEFDINFMRNESIDDEDRSIIKISSPLLLDTSNLDIDSSPLTMDVNLSVSSSSLTSQNLSLRSQVTDENKPAILSDRQAAHTLQTSPPLCKKLVSNIDLTIAIELSDTERPLKDRDKLLEELRAKYKNISPIVLVDDFQKTTIRNSNEYLRLREIPRKNYSGMVTDAEESISESSEDEENSIPPPSLLFPLKNNTMKRINISSAEEDGGDPYSRSFMTLFNALDNQIKDKSTKKAASYKETKPEPDHRHVETQSDSSSTSKNKLPRNIAKYNLDLLSDKELCHATSDDAASQNIDMDVDKDSKDSKSNVQTPPLNKHKVLSKKQKKTKNRLYFPSANEEKDIVKTLKKPSRTLYLLDKKAPPTKGSKKAKILPKSDLPTPTNSIMETMSSYNDVDTDPVDKPFIPPIFREKKTPLITTTTITETINTPSTTDSSSLKCAVCKVTFRSGKEIHDHRLVCFNEASLVRSQVKKYACEKCSFCYSTTDDLKDHVTYHTAFIMMCKVCGLTFHTLFAFDNHRKSHLSE